MKELSPRQRQVLEFVRNFIIEKGYPPTVRDIVRGCEMSSTSVAAYYLEILKKEGYIRRHPEISRGIELQERRHTIPVPIIGTIAAGRPIPVPAPDAWDNVSSAETVEVTADLVRGRNGVYALKVKGSSMIDALINDGDIILMQSVNAVDNGDMAAIWLKTEKEATLKKVYSERNRVRLQPANSQMKPIYTSPDNIEIQGRVIAVIRRIG